MPRSAVSASQTNFSALRWTSPDTTLEVARRHVDMVWWVLYTINTGWWLTYPSEKWWSSSVGMIIPNIWEKTCSKPPIRIISFFSGIPGIKQICSYIWLPDILCRSRVYAHGCCCHLFWTLRYSTAARAGWDETFILLFATLNYRKPMEICIYIIIYM